MKLHESIKALINQKGYHILTENIFVNALGDFHAFSEVPSSKHVLKDIIAEGYAEKIEKIYQGNDDWYNPFWNLVSDFIRKHAYKEDLVTYVFSCISFGMGWTDKVVDYIPTSANIQFIPPSNPLPSNKPTTQHNNNFDNSHHQETKPGKETNDSNEERGRKSKKRNTTKTISFIGMVLLVIIALFFYLLREKTILHDQSNNREDSLIADGNQDNLQDDNTTISEIESEELNDNNYDASSFVDAFFYNFTKNKFDGFTNKGTLNDIIEHDLYGETATAQNLETVIWEEGISFTNEIKLNDVVFVFDKIDVYEYDESHFDKENNTYEKQYHLSAPFQVIQYSFYLTGEASDNYKAIVEAMKTKLSGIYWVNFSDRTNHSIEYSYGESNQFSFLLIYTSTSIELRVYTDKYTYNTTINQIAR